MSMQRMTLFIRNIVLRGFLSCLSCARQNEWPVWHNFQGLLLRKHNGIFLYLPFRGLVDLEDIIGNAGMLD